MAPPAAGVLVDGRTRVAVFVFGERTLCLGPAAPAGTDDGEAVVLEHLNDVRLRERVMIHTTVPHFEHS